MPDTRVRKDGKLRGSGPQTWTCHHCGNDWTRLSARGQVPKWCPDCRINRPRRNQSGSCITCGRITGDIRCLRCKACEIARRNAAKIPVLYVGPPHRRQPRPNLNPIKVSTRRFKSGQCIICQAWFVTINMDRTCSPECADIRSREIKRECSDRRRAVKRNAYVDRVWRKRIFERDGYRCHLCRKKTNPKVKVPHPKAPTIDHVIPLAAGGTHEPLNCRTACFLCNSSKGDRGGGEQLLLIA